MTISLVPETRDRSVEFCGKRKSYDKGINELLDCKENCSPSEGKTGGGGKKMSKKLTIGISLFVLTALLIVMVPLNVSASIYPEYWGDEDAEEITAGAPDIAFSRFGYAGTYGSYETEDDKDTFVYMDGYLMADGIQYDLGIGGDPATDIPFDNVKGTYTGQIISPDGIQHAFEGYAQSIVSHSWATWYKCRVRIDFDTGYYIVGPSEETHYDHELVTNGYKVIYPIDVGKLELWIYCGYTSHVRLECTQEFDINWEDTVGWQSYAFFAFGPTLSTCYPHSEEYIMYQSKIALIDIIDNYIQDLPDDAFKNNPDQRKNAFSEKLDDVATLVEAEEYQEAADKLTNDIRAKMDGSVDGNANNDWIVDGDPQQYLCIKIDVLVGLLAE